MFPEGFIRRIRSQEYIDAEALLEALGQPSPVSIRLNPSKWQKVPQNAEPVPWCSTAFYLPSRPSYTLDPLFHSGCYYPQEASGMFLEQIFRQTVNSSGFVRVLDLCGAPGGKSTHLSSLIGKNGLLVSNEVIRSRAPVLKENITRWGNPNTIVTQSDPSAFRQLEGFFDVILVDAPCSGEGMFRDQLARNEWSEGIAAHCSERQKRILTDVWPSLAENGILIYSTCTFNPAENEQNIKWLVDKNEAESVQLKNSGFNGVAEIDYQGIKGYGFYPGKIRGEGLFFAVIRKRGKSGKKLKSGRDGDSLKVNKDGLKTAASWTDFSEDNLIHPGDDVVALSTNRSDFKLINQFARIIKAGTKIFTAKKNDYLPSYELALSTGLKSEAFPGVEVYYDQAVEYLKRGNPVIHNAPKGWFIIRFNGINLGFANNIGSRINNYFPVDMRIRMTIPENAVSQIIKWEE